MVRAKLAHFEETMFVVARLERPCHLLKASLLFTAAGDG